MRSNRSGGVSLFNCGDRIPALLVFQVATIAPATSVSPASTERPAVRPAHFLQQDQHCWIDWLNSRAKPVLQRPLLQGSAPVACAPVSRVRFGTTRMCSSEAPTTLDRLKPLRTADRRGFRSANRRILI